jgi:anti-anti-sigma factor
MALSIIHEQQDGAARVALLGRLTIGDATEDFHKAIRAAIESGAKRFILDFAKLDYVDSAGLSALVGAHVAACRVGGSIQLVNVLPRIQNLLSVSRLFQVFQLVSRSTDQSSHGSE